MTYLGAMQAPVSVSTASKLSLDYSTFGRRSKNDLQPSKKFGHVQRVAIVCYGHQFERYTETDLLVLVSTKVLLCKSVLLICSLWNTSKIFLCHFEASTRSYEGWGLNACN